MYRYSLEGQYDLAHNWIATLGYQGSTARHLTRQYNHNNLYGAEGIALNPMISDVDFYANDANSNFNAFLAQIQHQFSYSFQIDGQHRYAKSMDQGSQPYNVDQYQWNPQLAWGLPDWDVRNLFKVWGVWQPHIFHSPEHGWVEKIVGGWSVSGIFSWHSGFPWTAVYTNIDGGNVCKLVYNTGCAQPNGSNNQLRPATYRGTAGSSQGIKTFKTQNGNFTGITTGTSANAGAPFFTVPAFTN